MSDPVSVVRRLLALFAGVLVTAAATATAAQASYGEIGHFGGVRGTGAGQFEAQYEAAIGVDPENNSVYVVDMPDEENIFRIQKFEKLTKEGSYQVVASATFKPKDDELKEEEFDTVEGVAVDTKLKRVYVLADEERGKNSTIDVDDEAASELFAFSTEQSGSTLEPAIPGAEEGLFASTKVLSPLSNKQGTSLLEPGGIAVDPKTHDVILLGKEDNGTEEITALEQITEAGKLGERWTDKGNYFEGDAVSPAVSANGNIYVDDPDGNETGVDEIAEVPSNFSEEAAPKPLLGTVFTESLEDIVNFPGEPAEESGGSLSIGEEGTIFSRASIRQQVQGQPEFQYPGVVEFNEKGEEEGWTGGQSAASGGGKCTIALAPAAQIAAGKEHDVFVYSDNYLDPTIIEFGPGGSGCASATATTPTVSLNGQPVEGEEPIPQADEVTISSKLRQANALSVTWEFGDGTKETVGTRQYQTTEVTHHFAQTGPLTITEKIRTDDLATPEIVVTRKVDVLSPQALTDTAIDVEKTSAKLQGTVTPSGIDVTECYFEYGTSTKYESGKAPCQPAPGSSKTAVPVSATITGLSEATDYDYKLVAKYVGNAAEGANATFKTPPAPTVTIGQASSIGQTSATLNATVNPNGVAIKSCQFEYGTSEGSLTKSVPCSTTPASGTSPVAVSAAVTGLSPGTKYYFQIAASNAAWTSLAEKAGTFSTENSSSGGGNSGGNGGETGGGGGGTTTTTNGGGVLGNVTVEPGPPNVTLSGASASVSSAGAFTLKLVCPAEETSCAGTITLKTLKAVVASLAHAAKGKSKAAILTLASGSFTLTGGQTKTVTLHLSSQARALLAHSHVLLARATILARNAKGLTHTTTVTVTLRLASKPAKKHH
jgi:hypothetical protein